MTHEPFWVRVRTDSATDGLKPKPDIIKDIDWRDSDDRKWLNNHLHWAVNNFRTVTIYATPYSCVPSREARNG